MTSSTPTDLLEIERKITALGPEALAEFRRWFAEFDAASWDRQLEDDVAAGRLDRLAEQALQDHAAGRSTEI